MNADHPVHPVWGYIDPWPVCETCKRRVYKVSDLGEWRHR